MSQHILRKPVIDVGALEREIQRRLHRGKARLLIQDVLFFILAVMIIFFVI